MKKFTISRDDNIYEAWPDVVLSSSGKLICVFSECTHHINRDYSRIMLVDSTDKGRTWSAKRPLTEETNGIPFYNNPRISQLKDGRLVIIIDKLFAKEEEAKLEECRNYLYFSNDDGNSWSAPQETPMCGIVPDKLLELPNGRWILAAHYKTNGFLAQFMRFSDDCGKTWSDRISVGEKAGLNLCEASILPIGEDNLVAFMRENSGLGRPCYKTISEDNGLTWKNLTKFPLPGCHRPVSGILDNGQIMITYRFAQGGKGGFGKMMQNFFVALTDQKSVLANSYKEAWTRIIPLDYDCSPASDLGYSGWVQFDDGEIYIVNYIMDNAPTAYICGYSMTYKDIFDCKKF